MDDIESLFYPEKKAGGFSRYSGTVQFFQRVQALLRPGDIVLDFGAGRGAYHREDCASYPKKLRSLRGECRRVIGIDIDPAVATNPSIDEAIVLKPGASLPFTDATFDLIISDFVFEHIADPAQVASELDRVLKRGGWLCVRTTNRNGYVAVANRITPSRLWKRLALAASRDREECDVFGAYYRMNTLRKIRQLFPIARYEHASFAFDSEPQYHFNRRSMFMVLVFIHALTPPSFRNTLMCFLHKRM